MKYNNLVEIHKKMLKDIIQIEVDLKEVSFFIIEKDNNLALIKNYRLSRNGVRQEQANFKIVSKKGELYNLEYLGGSTKFFDQK